MRIFFIEIRNIPALNKPIRTMLRTFKVFTHSFFDKLISRWRVSGIIDFDFDNIGKFQMLSNCDDVIVDSLYYNEYNEILELEIFATLCGRSRTILDIGANTGIYSVVAGISNTKSRIFAFEPYMANAERLKLNLELNQVKNVQVVHQAVDSYNGLTTFYVPKGQKRISQVCSKNRHFSESHLQNDITDYEEINIEVTSLDFFVDQQEIINIDLVKIDVESLEMEVLLGSHQFIKVNRPIILIEIFYSIVNRKKILDFLVLFNYELYMIYENKLFKVDNILISNRINYLLIPSDHQHVDMVNQFIDEQ